MQTRRTLALGQKGAKKFLEHYSEQLICVRYRYDEQRCIGAVVATALSVVKPISTSIISVGLLGKTMNDYRAAKRKVLKNHAMS